MLTKVCVVFVYLYSCVCLPNVDTKCLNFQTQFFPLAVLSFPLISFYLMWYYYYVCACIFFCHFSVFYVNNNNFEGNETDLIVYFFFLFMVYNVHRVFSMGSTYTVQYPFEALAFYLSAVSSIFVFRHSLQTAFFLLSLSLSE